MSDQRSQEANRRALKQALPPGSPRPAQPFDRVQRPSPMPMAPPEQRVPFSKAVMAPPATIPSDAQMQMRDALSRNAAGRRTAQGTMSANDPWSPMDAFSPQGLMGAAQGAWQFFSEDVPMMLDDAVGGVRSDPVFERIRSLREQYDPQIAQATRNAEASERQAFDRQDAFLRGVDGMTDATRAMRQDLGAYGFGGRRPSQPQPDGRWRDAQGQAQQVPEFGPDPSEWTDEQIMAALGRSYR